MFGADTGVEIWLTLCHTVVHSLVTIVTSKVCLDMCVCIQVHLHINVCACVHVTLEGISDLQTDLFLYFLFLFMVVIN